MTTRDTIMEFEILIEPEDGGYHVWCPVLKGCRSFGVTKDEARINIREAIEGWIESARDEGIAIPEPEIVKITVP